MQMCVSWQTSRKENLHENIQTQLTTKFTRKITSIAKEFLECLSLIPLLRS